MSEVEQVYLEKIVVSADRKYIEEHYSDGVVRIWAEKRMGKAATTRELLEELKKLKYIH
jgi:hypothetical protein